MTNKKSHIFKDIMTFIWFNLIIERQLDLLTTFWQQNNGAGEGNADLQTDYYDFLQEESFVVGDAQNKPKDAREKTSGLVDIGLITSNRKISKVGDKLLEISQNAYFTKNNILQISNDSLLYVKQLLKTANQIDDDFVRPYIIVVSAILELQYISYEEFTFLLLLITNQLKYNNIINKIKELRYGRTSIDDIVIDVLMSMENYQEALKLLQNNNVTENLIMDIGINRKSRTYDKPYFKLYKALKKLVFNFSDNNIEPLFQTCKGISGKSSLLWKQYLFNTSNERRIKNEKTATINKTQIFNCKTEENFKILFFKLLHLFKAKATLSDYFDLNRRYLNITDTIIFKDEKVELDIVPNCFFGLCKNLEKIAFTESDSLFENIDFEYIIPDFDVKETVLFQQLEKKYGVKIDKNTDAKNFIDNQRLERFNKLIDEKFTDAILLELLNDFETRNDNAIRDKTTDNAQIYSIFEYIVAIVWYKISERKGNILEFMNLSLDANLLPKTHAAGGGEDITFQYEKTQFYPKHTLLIEPTLSEKNTQRRMEMEPVSRHLGDHLLHNGNENDYALFVSTFLHLNIISDFRGRKNISYYNSNGTQSVEGMKIIPFQTSELKTVLANKLKYNQLYKIFETAYLSNTQPNNWYNTNIIEKLYIQNK